MNQVPSLTIITVNKNGGHSLQITIDSVLNQTSKDFQWILVDGHSTDASLEIIKKNTKCFDVILTDSNGIYPAMNLGMQYAKSDWLLFLNGGDLFADINIIEKFIALDKSNINMVMGSFIKDGTIRRPREPDKNTIFYGMPTCHQAIFYKNLCIPYDLKYKFASDFLMTLNYFYLCNSPFILEFPICISTSGGVSDKKYIQLGFEYISICKSKNRFMLGIIYFLVRISAKLTYMYFPKIYFKFKK